MRPPFRARSRRQGQTRARARCQRRKRVVLEAKRLLAHTDLPISRIGAAVSFPNVVNFSKFFHLHTGTTPVALRAELC